MSLQKNTRNATSIWPAPVWLRMVVVLLSFLVLTVPAQAQIVEEAKNSVADLSLPPSVPTSLSSTPPYEPQKTVYYLSTDEENPVSKRWGEIMAEAATDLGWRYRVLDGEGNPLRWVGNLGLALQIGVDGIITSMDLTHLKPLSRDARRARIPIVGIHSAPLPGPDREVGLYTNISPDPRAIGRAQADWVIADSEGQAKVVVVTDCSHPRACAQSTSVQSRLEECPDCEILEVYDAFLEKLPNLLPEVVPNWLESYDAPFYVVSVADYFLDFVVPALEASDAPRDGVILVGSNGTTEAYERIRRGDQFQRVTTAEAPELEAYQAVDEMIRALYGSQPSFWTRRPFLVTADNIDMFGGSENRLTPNYDFKAMYRERWEPVPEEETSKLAP